MSGSIGKIFATSFKKKAHHHHYGIPHCEPHDDNPEAINTERRLLNIDEAIKECGDTSP